MEENEKVIVKEVVKKTELPISLYLLMFLQIALLAIIAWDIDCAATYLMSMYYGI